MKLTTYIPIIVGGLGIVATGDAEAAPLAFAAAGSMIAGSMAAAAGVAATATFMGITAAGWGWMIGGMVGSMLQNTLFAPDNVSESPKLSDLRVQGTEYGRPIPWINGKVRMAGDIWWASEKRAIRHETEQGGKGGPSATSITYTYEVDMIVGLVDQEINALEAIFNNGKLIYSVSPTAGGEAIDASASETNWNRMTVYKGTETQLPDPDYEAAVGAGMAPAYRGRAYVFFKSFQLDGAGNMPNLSFIISAGGSPFLGDELAVKSMPIPPNESFFLPYQPLNTICRVGDSIYSAYRLHDTFNGNMLGWFGIRFDVRSLTWAVHRSVTGINWSAATKVPIQQTDIPIFAVCLNLTDLCRLVNTVEDPITGINAQVNLSGYAATNGGSGTFTSLCKVGDDIYTVGFSTSTSYINRFSWSSGGLPSANASRATPTNVGYECVIVIGDKLYAMYEVDPVLIDVWDVATLTYIETITSPPGSWWFGGADDNHIFTGDRGTLWILNDYEAGNGNIEFWEYNFETKIWTSKLRPPVGTTQPHLTVQYGNSLWGLSEAAATSSIVQIGPIDAGVSSTPTVQSFVEEVLYRSGMNSALTDTAPLSTITRPMRSYAASGLPSGRTILEEAAAVFFFGMKIGSKLGFVPRGGAVSKVLTYQDIGASLGGSGDKAESLLPFRQSTDIELPARTALTYLNVDHDYLPDTQHSDRMVTTIADSVDAIQVNFGMTAPEAKTIVDATVLDREISRLSSEVKLGGWHYGLEPTDRTTIPDKNGKDFTWRITRKTEEFPLIAVDITYDEASVLISEALTSTDYFAQTEVAVTPGSLIFLLDAPMLRDSDNVSGFIVAGRGKVDTGWNGLIVYKSPDNIQFTMISTISEKAIAGYTAPGASLTGSVPSPLRMFDVANRVRVNVNGLLTSSTRDAVLNDQTINAMMIGSEVLQFVTVNLIESGTHYNIYELSELLRGSRGTEWAVGTHVIGEPAVLLRMSGLRFVEMPVTELNNIRYYKGISSGMSLDAELSQQFTNTGAVLKPFAPVRLAGGRDATGNITITCQRRSRFACTLIGTTGINIPLGETTEAYDLEIWATSGFTTLKRTITAFTSSGVNVTFTYTSADQVTDFGSNQATVWLRIYQRSATVGRGYKLEGSV